MRELRPHTVTSTLRGSLYARGWTGYRYTNQAAWPQDFLEACSSNYGTGGVDSSYADAYVSGRLAVYAGHGNKGLLQWGYKTNNRCTVNFQNNMRLGSMAGAKAGYAVYITSCTLHTSSLVTGANYQWLYQQFGYHNSPAVGDDQPSEWFQAIDTQTNVQAWLDEMEDKPGLFTGDNSPIVVSQGSTWNSCLWQQNNAKLRGVIVARSGGPACNAGQPLFYYCTMMYNNGDSGC